MEDISNLVNNYDMNQILNQEDQDEIFGELQQLGKEKGIPLTKPNIMNLFVENVKEFLHIVLIFSPLGNQFRKRIRQVIM